MSKWCNSVHGYGILSIIEMRIIESILCCIDYLQYGNLLRQHSNDKVSIQALAIPSNKIDDE